MTYKEIKNNPEINAYIAKGDKVLGIMGFTEHSFIHATKTAVTAGRILEKLGYEEHEIELAKIAGYMHDMGNCVNRINHAHTGAIMSFQLLKEKQADPEDIAAIIAAIGQHDEGSGMPVDPVSAALILADKTDVRRDRVRNMMISTFDKHDRVNYAAVSSKLEINPQNKVISLEIKLDEEICSIMDYFEIFLQRMLMCRRACEILGMEFELTANGHRVG